MSNSIKYSAEVIGFINPTVSTKDMTVEEYNQAILDLVAIMNDGYELEVSRPSPKDGRISIKVLTRA